MPQSNGPHLSYAVICEKVLHEIVFREVSVFDTPDAAAKKARARNLGDYLAVLEVPDDFPMSHGRQGHKGLIGTNPSQLLGYVKAVYLVAEF